MSRGLRLTAVAVVLVLLAGVAVLLGWIPRGALRADQVTLHRVERGPFLRTATAEGYLRAVQATPISVPVEADSMQRVAWTVPDGTSVRRGDTVIRFDPTEMERSLADGRDNRQTSELKIRRTTGANETERSNLLAEVSLARREYAQAERFAQQDEEIFSRREIIDSEIDQELARAKAEAALQRSELVEREGRTQIDLLEIEKGKAELKVDAAEKGLASLTVQAPHDGLLVLERNWRGETTRPGDQVWPGQKLAEIPDPRQMQARVFVLEADAGGLEAGRRATLVVEAHPEKEFAARVERVEALAKRRFWSVPVQYFEATLAPEETDPEIMKPGQRVRTEIVLEEIEDALTVPRQAIVDQDGKKIVYRQEGLRLVPVEVTLGSHSLSRVQVATGLKEGDRVALRDPNRSPDETLTGTGTGENGTTVPGVAP